MKITKNILNLNNIHNSYNLAEKVGNKIFINYVPADEGGLSSHYAYWQSQRLDFIITQNKSKQGTKDFTVSCRENKLPKLQEAIKWIKNIYGIEITDKDPFGGWHPKETISKLEKLIDSEKK